MIRACIVIGQLGVGGGERQLFLLLEGLVQKKKYHLTVISFNPGKNDFWEEPIRNLGVDLRFIPRKKNPIARIALLYKQIKTLKPDVLVSWTLHLNFFVGSIGKFAGAKKTIGSIRNDLFNPMKKDRPVHRWFGTKGPQVFIANSTKGKRDMVEKLGLEPTRVKVIFNAVELPSNLEPVTSEEWERLGIPEDSFVLVNIGRLETSKNQAMIIRAVKLARDKGAKVCAALMGEGPWLPGLKKLANDLNVENAIVFTGKIPMAVRYLSKFDAMCHTGLADGMPNVLLEGASQGLPLLSTRVNGSEDIIIEGQGGYIVEYNDDNAMAEKIVELYENKPKREALGKFSQAYVCSDRFSKATMVEKFDSVFSSLLHDQ